MGFGNLWSVESKIDSYPDLVKLFYACKTYDVKVTPLCLKFVPDTIHISLTSITLSEILKNLICWSGPMASLYDRRKGLMENVYSCSGRSHQIDMYLLAHQCWQYCQQIHKTQSPPHAQFCTLRASIQHSLHTLYSFRCPNQLGTCLSFTDVQNQRSCIF